VFSFYPNKQVVTDSLCIIKNSSLKSNTKKNIALVAEPALNENWVLFYFANA
jgi:hypothetical protein